MTEIETLARRVAAAAGASRELDQAIELTMPGVLPHPYEPPVSGYVISGADHPVHSPGQGYLAPNYTVSLDAAASLYVDRPERIPSNPRLAAAEALRQRADR